MESDMVLGDIGQRHATFTGLLLAASATEDVALAASATEDVAWSRGAVLAGQARVGAMPV